MSEQAARPSIASQPAKVRETAREVTGYWWVGLVAGISWLVISLVILQFDAASITTVGLLVSLMFLLAAVQNFTLTTLPLEHRWVPGLFGVLFLVASVICLINPVETFAGLAEMLGFLFLLVGVWWMVQAFLERPLNPMWWLGLISGILMTGVAFWSAGQLFTTRVYTLLVFAGLWALMQGIVSIARAFEIRRLNKEL